MAFHWPWLHDFFVKSHMFIKKKQSCIILWMATGYNQPSCFPIGAKRCKSMDGWNSKRCFWVPAKVPHISAASGNGILLKGLLGMESTKQMGHFVGRPRFVSKNGYAPSWGKFSQNNFHTQQTRRSLVGSFQLFCSFQLQVCLFPKDPCMVYYLPTFTIKINHSCR